MSGPCLNRQLVLETRRDLADGSGGFIAGWQILGALWAEVNARTGRDRAGEAVAVASVTVRIVVRGAPCGSSARPVAGQRFRDGARVYRIEAVAGRDPDGRYLTCFAKEETAA